MILQQVLLLESCTKSNDLPYFFLLWVWILANLFMDNFMLFLVVCSLNTGAKSSRNVSSCSIDCSCAFIIRHLPSRSCTRAGFWRSHFSHRRLLLRAVRQSRAGSGYGLWPVGAGGCRSLASDTPAIPRAL